MDYNVLNPQEDKKSVTSYQGFNQDSTSSREIPTIYKEPGRDFDNALKLNNSGQNANNTPSHLPTNSVIQLTKRNILHDETNKKKIAYENDINDEEKENQYSEVI